MTDFQTKQGQMYLDIVQLVANIARDGFGIDVLHNPLFTGVFQQQLEHHHQRLVDFILKYVPAESPPVPSPIPANTVQQEHTTAQPSQNFTLPDTEGNSEQSKLILTSK